MWLTCSGTPGEFLQTMKLQNIHQRVDAPVLRNTFSPVWYDAMCCAHSIQASGALRATRNGSHNSERVHRAGLHLRSQQRPKMLLPLLCMLQLLQR